MYRNIIRKYFRI